MNITDLEMFRCMSGHGTNAAMVGRLSWKQDGKEFGTESPCGEQEEDLLEALEQCVYEMLKQIDNPPAIA